MRRAIPLSALGVWVMACGPGLPAADDESGGASTSVAAGSSSSAVSTVSAMSTSEGVVTTSGGAAVTGGVMSGIGSLSGSTSEGGSEGGTAADDDGAGVTFIGPPDGGILDYCDVWGQDCPVGEKCVPYASQGGSSWDALKCVPVAREPKQVDEPCVAEGSGVSGIDDCDVGLYCWDTDAEGEGTCLALCSGSPESPTCAPPGTFCEVSRSGVVNLCLKGCNPLEEGVCQDDDVCISNSDIFICVLDASGEEGQVNDHCSYANACDPGLGCVWAASAKECEPQWDGCCQPFCDTTKANTCAGEGQSCQAWFEEGTAPVGYENIGICSLPG